MVDRAFAIYECRTGDRSRDVIQQFRGRLVEVERLAVGLLALSPCSGKSNRFADFQSVLWVSGVNAYPQFGSALC